MSRALSPSFARCYGLARVARVWKISRASVYRSLKETLPNTITVARSGRRMFGCAAGSRRQIDASRLHGKGTASYGRDCALLAFARAPAVCDG